MLDNLTMTTANGAQRAFIEAATLAEMQVESGAFDYVTAIRNAVHTAASGGAWVLYPTGARSRLDTATRRAVLTRGKPDGRRPYAGLRRRYGLRPCGDHGAHGRTAGARGVAGAGVQPQRQKAAATLIFVTATGYGTGPGLCGELPAQLLHVFEGH